MIYIISGVSRSGKTTVCKRISKELDIPYLSIDHLMMGFYIGMPETGVDHETYSYVIAEKMWPFIRGMLISMITSGENYILEGEAFNARDVEGFLKEYPNTIKIVYMGYENIDPEVKVKAVKQYADKHDWLIAKNDDFILDHINNMRKLSTRVKMEANECNMKYFEISKDFNKDILKVQKFITEK